MHFAYGRLAFVVTLLAACGSDSDGSGSASETGTTGDTTPTSDPTTTTDDPTLTPGSSDDSSTSAGTSPDTTAADTTAADTTGTTGDTDTNGIDCTAIPPGPFAAERILMDVPFDGSEDLGFDGQGHIAARGDQDSYLLVSADGTYEEITTDNRPTYGVRFLANGDLVAAAYEAGDILRITPDGQVDELATNVGGVNGLFPDASGGVWYTNFAVVGYITPDGNPVSVVTPAANANGVFFDEARQIVFFTNYGTGDLRKSEIVDGLAEPPVSIGEIDGNPDGITLDACGNLYINDQGGSEMYRLYLDDAAMPIGEAELLVDGGFPTNVANAQFGTGEGWESTSLYAIGVGGGLYRVDVGVPGAPYVTVE